MEKMNVEQFVNHYIEAWSTQNTQLRNKLVKQVYSEQAEFYADEPGDEAVAYCGLDEIYTNISQVNERLVVGNGLITESKDFSENHETVRIRWQMKKPDGEIALEGMNLLLLNENGKIEKDYIFIN